MNSEKNEKSENFYFDTSIGLIIGIGFANLISSIATGFGASNPYYATLYIFTIIFLITTAVSAVAGISFKSILSSSIGLIAGFIIGAATNLKIAKLTANLAIQNDFSKTVSNIIAGIAAFSATTVIYGILFGIVFSLILITVNKKTSII